MRRGIVDNSLNTRMKSVGERRRCGSRPLKITWLGLAEFFSEGEDAEALLNTA